MRPHARGQLNIAEMRMKSVFVMIMLSFFSTVFAMEGSKKFQEKGCVACHDAKLDRVKRGLGPSIAQIKENYGSDVAAVVLFLKKEGKPRVYPNRYELMKQQLDSILLSNEERKLLAEFLLQ